MSIDPISNGVASPLLEAITAPVKIDNAERQSRYASHHNHQCLDSVADKYPRRQLLCAHFHFLFCSSTHVEKNALKCDEGPT